MLVNGEKSSMVVAQRAMSRHLCVWGILCALPPATHGEPKRRTRDGNQESLVDIDVTMVQQIPCHDADEYAYSFDPWKWHFFVARRS